MKQILNIIAAIGFSTLFYNQGLGINLVLFSLLTVTVLYINTKEDFFKVNIIINKTKYLFMLWLEISLNNNGIIIKIGISINIIYLSCKTGVLIKP